jgi:hypothetical protein
MQNVPKIVRERLKAATPAVNHPDADLLTAFAEHSLPGIERDIVLEHLARCGDCREVVALALPATEPVQTVVSPSSSPSSGWLTWPALRWAFVAAGVIAIASFGIMQYQKSTHPATVADRSTAPQAATTEAKNQLLAAPVAPAPAEKRNEIQAPPASGDSVSGTNLMVMQSAGPSADSRSQPNQPKKTVARAEVAGRAGPTGSIGSTLGDQKTFGPKANQFQQQNIAQNQAPAPAPPVAFGKEQASARSSADATVPTVEASGAAPQVAPAQNPNQNLDSTLAQNQPAVQPPSTDAYAFEKMSRAKLPVPPGQIGGYVVDPSGAVVANARITLIPSKAGQNATAVTNSQGLWLIAGVPTGTYKAQAEAPGFRTTIASVNYDANQPSMYSFTLNVGSAAETVEVAAQNGQIQNEQIRTETAANVADGEIRQLPINSRNVNELVTLSPGPLWAINSTGALRRSVDQGKTWQDVDVNANPASITSASLAVSAQVSRAKAKQADKDLKQQPATPTFHTVAAAGAEVWAGGSGGALYHSADAGLHWTRVVPAATGTILTGDITSLEFPDPQHGKLATTTAEVWTTSDGGQTWQKQ